MTQAGTKSALTDKTHFIQDILTHVRFIIQKKYTDWSVIEVNVVIESGGSRVSGETAFWRNVSRQLDKEICKEEK